MVCTKNMDHTNTNERETTDDGNRRKELSVGYSSLSSFTLHLEFIKLT